MALKPSQHIALWSLSLMGIVFACLLAIDTWFPWWIDLIGALLIGGAVQEASMKYEAQKRLIDRDL